MSMRTWAAQFRARSRSFNLCAVTALSTTSCRSQPFARSSTTRPRPVSDETMDVSRMDVSSAERTSASPMVAAQNPFAPNSRCNRQISRHLWALKWGRWETPVPSRRRLMAATFDRRTSRSMTSAGVGRRSRDPRAPIASCGLGAMAVFPSPARPWNRTTSVSGLDRQDRAVRVEQDPLRLAAGDQLPGGRAAPHADDDQAGLEPVGGVHDLVGGVVAGHPLVDLVDHPGAVRSEEHTSELQSRQYL